MKRPPARPRAIHRSCVTSHSLCARETAEKPAGNDNFRRRDADGADDFRDLSLSGCHAAVIMRRELNALTE